MKNIITLFVTLLLFISSNILAQLTVKDQEPIPNTLFEVIDDGISGVLLIPPLVTLSVDPDQKLYNIGGTLYWNGNQIGTSFTAAGWTYDGTHILTSTVNDKVGIGMSTAPNVKLSLGTDFASKKLAIWDGANDFYGFGSPFGRMAIYTSDNERMSILGNGNIGIGTTTPDANLEVNGTVKVGTSGVKFSEIYELIGTTDGAGTFSIVVSFPSGYDKENTRVLSLEINADGTRWISQGYYFTSYSASFFCVLDNVINIFYPNDSSFQSKTFRLVLMKVE